LVRLTLGPKTGWGVEFFERGNKKRMKSERRHELEHNELSDWLANFIEKVKPYSNSILSGALIGVLLLVVLGFWKYRTEQSTAQAWNAFYNASGSSADELIDMAEEYSSSPAGQWAMLLAGDRYRMFGFEQLFTNKEAGINELAKADECYQYLLTGSRNSELRQRALFGLGQVAEAKAELEKAQKYYEQLTHNFPEGPFSAIANSRLDDLKRPETISFYEQFAAYNPKPAFEKEPGTPGEKLPFEEEKIEAPKEEAKPEVKSEAKPKETKPEVKPETKLEPKAEEKKPEPAK
jgi:tetratricopeptide (TPR) repeat protein